MPPGTGISIKLETQVLTVMTLLMPSILSAGMESKHKKYSAFQNGTLYNQYLAYHEGHGGFKRKTYNQKTLANESSTQSRKARQTLFSAIKKMPQGTGNTLGPLAILVINNDSTTIMSGKQNH